MDIDLLRKNPTANQRRIVELKRSQTQMLREQKALAADWKDELVGRSKTQTTNVRRMMMAVFVSKLPGQIEYGQTPPDMTQATDYKKRVSMLQQLQKSSDGVAVEIKRLEQEETKINVRSAQERRIGSYQEWHRNYGQPKRVPDKFERYLSYVKPPSKKVAGAKSKDGTVVFPATISNALPVRKGILTD